MLNWIWLGLILIAVVTAAFTGQMEPVYKSIFDTATSSISLVIKLVGGMVFFLGLTRVAFDGGLRDWIARGLGPSSSAARAFAWAKLLCPAHRPEPSRTDHAEHPGRSHRRPPFIFSSTIFVFPLNVCREGPAPVVWGPHRLAI